MRRLKHLPVEDWPEADRDALAKAYLPGDIFDETNGPGAHHSEGWRRMIRTSYRRWLGFLKEHYPADLLRGPAERITPERVRTFVEQLSTEVRSTTAAMSIANLYGAARLIAPDADWRWLASLRARLASRARSQNRFERLVPPWHTFDLGLKLMEKANRLPRNVHKEQDLQYRDGLILVFVSLWNIRRRSLEALTVSRHVEFTHGGVNLLLFPQDTKSKRDESFPVPEPILPYLMHYLKIVRPRLVGRNTHALGFIPRWPSEPRSPLRYRPRASQSQIRQGYGPSRFPPRCRDFPRHRGARQDRPHPRHAAAHFAGGERKALQSRPDC